MEKARLPAMVVVAIMSAAFGAGGSWAVTKDRADATAAALVLANAKADTLEKRVTEQGTLIAVLQTDATWIKASLERIEKKLGISSD